MKKKTKKAAKKPRPKTVTLKTWGVHCHDGGDLLCSFTTRAKAKQCCSDCDQVVRITYEVRR